MPRATTFCVGLVVLVSDPSPNLEWSPPRPGAAAVGTVQWLTHLSCESLCPSPSSSYLREIWRLGLVPDEKTTTSRSPCGVEVAPVGDSPVSGGVEAVIVSRC